jgi:hypothetical protein
MGPPSDRRPPFTLPCASHNPPGPVAAGRGKGRPQADPEGTRSGGYYAKRPSGDRGSRHADRGGTRAADTASVPTCEPRILFRSQCHERGPDAAAHWSDCPSPHPVPKRFNKTRLYPNVTNHESAGQAPYQRRATGAQSRGGSSRCTRLCGSAVNRRHSRARAGPAPDSSSLMRLCLAHARAPFFRRSSRMLLVQQLREPIPPGPWHHRGEVERARLAAG